MDGRVLYDETTRRRAAALFEEGMGYKAVAREIASTDPAPDAPGPSAPSTEDPF